MAKKRLIFCTLTSTEAKGEKAELRTQNPCGLDSAFSREVRNGVVNLIIGHN